MKPDKKFKAYAQNDCLEVDLMFDAEIIISDGTEQLKTVARFYVVKRGPQPLLGKTTAKHLGVLRVGLPSRHELIQQIATVKRFPSIHGVKIHIPIDKSVEPFSSLSRVEDMLAELLSKDIIEKVEEPIRWVSPLVVVQKDSGDIRLCVDLRQLKEYGILLNQAKCAFKLKAVDFLVIALMEMAYLRLKIKLLLSVLSALHRQKRKCEAS